MFGLPANTVSFFSGSCVWILYTVIFFIKRATGQEDEDEGGQK
jgi:hypothetical protein